MFAAEGYSIYIRNLPPRLTASQLESEFQKFGPIKKNGVQVRNNRVGGISCLWFLVKENFCINIYVLLIYFSSVKQHGFCFGFVEFEDPSSMQSAIQVRAVVVITCLHICTTHALDGNRSSHEQLFLLHTAQLSICRN